MVSNDQGDVEATKRFDVYQNTTEDRMLCEIYIHGQAGMTRGCAARQHALLFEVR